ncbi:MAG: hypothetical protein OXO49_02010 [Gammaproteobacteria bacterium]|nr:hypothetical protein [Gammaproteobacteria bacterium]MDE0251279.1 hypothetical protein [Gammaproteobacteria bacterium]MDE0402036.1 hypothetical protein [Gammaproteobacteria bacterium]
MAESNTDRFSDAPQPSLVRDEDGRIIFPEDPEEIRKIFEFRPAMDYFIKTGDRRVLDAIEARNKLVESKS